MTPHTARDSPTAISPKTKASIPPTVPSYSHDSTPRDSMHDIRAAMNDMDLHLDSDDNKSPGEGGERRAGVDFAPCKLYPLIPHRLYFAAHQSDKQTLDEIRSHPQRFYCSTDLQDRYEPFCADFGPVHIGIVVQFCDYLHAKMQDKRLRNRPVVYYSGTDSESISNTAFLLAAFLMLECGRSPEQAFEPFRHILNAPIVPFRDPTYCKSTFALTITDCLRGIERARELGWFDHIDFDLEAFEDLYDPLAGGDISQLCPKFVAFRGPADEQATAEAAANARAPEHYIRKLSELNVRTVIRLNGAETYDKRAFEQRGFSHHDLAFADCTTPTDDQVARFLELCGGEDEGEVVGVHCLAGLGRTGTMVALWMMSARGFSAREAIGWLRLVRPGSVIGPQQHYLERMEARIADASFPYDRASAEQTLRLAGGSAQLADDAVLARKLSKDITDALARR